jgi:ParB family transcriptional regulator, chromosome partitioning protein
MSRRLRTYLESCQQIEPLEISLLIPSDKQIRSDLGDLSEISASIREHGLLNPLLVRPKGSRFEVICGNRRLEACRRLMKRYVDCIIRDLSDQTAFEISIVENVQRATLSPLEEAKAFQNYVSEFGWGGVSDLALRIGKSQEYVSHRILLLDLPRKIISKLEKNSISPSQAQELLWLREQPLRDQILNQIESEKLSVADIRQIRKEMESKSSHQKLGQSSSEAQSPDSKADFELERPNISERRSTQNREESRDRKAVDEAILALRIALIRLDSAISKCETKASRDLLMDERLTLHGQIDRLIKAKTKVHAC